MAACAGKIELTTALVEILLSVFISCESVGVLGILMSNGLPRDVYAI